MEALLFSDECLPDQKIIFFQLDPSPGFFSQILTDVIVTVEFIIVAFELGVILENYGLLVWLVKASAILFHRVLTLQLLVSQMYRSPFRGVGGS